MPVYTEPVSLSLQCERREQASCSVEPLLARVSDAETKLRAAEQGEAVLRRDNAALSAHTADLQRQVSHPTRPPHTHTHTGPTSRDRSVTPHGRPTHTHRADLQRQVSHPTRPPHTHTQGRPAETGQSPHTAAPHTHTGPTCRDRSVTPHGRPPHTHTHTHRADLQRQVSYPRDPLLTTLRSTNYVHSSTCLLPPFTPLRSHPSVHTLPSVGSCASVSRRRGRRATSRSRWWRVSSSCSS